VASLSHRAVGVQHATVPVVGELVEAAVGHDHRGVADLGIQVGEPTLSTPLGSTDAGARASLCSGTPYSMIPPTPAANRLNCGLAQ